MESEVEGCLTGVIELSLLGSNVELPWDVVDVGLIPGEELETDDEVGFLESELVVTSLDNGAEDLVAMVVELLIEWVEPV